MSQAQVPDVQSIVRPTAGALLIGVLFSVWWSSIILPSYLFLLTLAGQPVWSKHPTDLVLLSTLSKRWSISSDTSTQICNFYDTFIWYVRLRSRASGRPFAISLEFSWTVPVRIFEVLHAIFECHAIYFYLVQNFDNIPGLDITPWYEPIISSILFLKLFFRCPIV